MSSVVLKKIEALGTDRRVTERKVAVRADHYAAFA
jgi:hypothetical protein